jgi:CheY-like chemotaxis protein
MFNAEITIVSTSYEASAYIRSVLFDLLLVEVNLPDLRGDLIVGFAPEGFKLGMSASHTSPEIRSHFDEFLLKPFVEDELIRILTNMQFQYLHSINNFSYIP